jgi:hypothetical protein
VSRLDNHGQDSEYRIDGRRRRSMTILKLERRVRSLEAQVAQLQDELRSIQRPRQKDWRRTIGAFTDDEGMKELLRDAMRLREADRKRARAKGQAKRCPKP